MRGAPLVALGGAATAAVSLLLAGVAGGPYLSSDHVNGWIVVFAAAVLAVLVAAPFVIEAHLRGRRPSREDDRLTDERWEGAALVWGGLMLAVLAVAVPVGLAESFSGDSLAGTAALLGTIEAGLVVLALLAWLLAG